MILAAGKSIEFVVGPGRNNGAPHWRTVRTYISLGDILDQLRPVAAHAGHPSVHCLVPDQWGHNLQVPLAIFDRLMLRYLLPIYLNDERKTPGASKLRSGINIETGAGVYQWHQRIKRANSSVDTQVDCYRTKINNALANFTNWKQTAKGLTCLRSTIS